MTLNIKSRSGVTIPYKDKQEMNMSAIS